MQVLLQCLGCGGGWGEEAVEELEEGVCGVLVRG